MVYKMSEQEVTNPIETVEMTGSTEGVTETEQSVDVATLDPSEVSEEPELIDYDFDGEVLKLKPEIKEKLEKERMMQADYTRKTQELAQQRKQLEQMQAQAQQFDQEYVNDLAQARALDNQLEQYQKVDWNALIQADAVQAQQLRIQYDQLKDQRVQLDREIGAKSQQRQLAQQQAIAKQIEEGQRVLAEKIPDWSAEKAQKLVEHATSYGFTAQEASQISDPRAVQLLHDAMLYRQLTAKQPTKQEAKVAPAAKVKTKAPASKDMSKLPIDEWMKQRTKQVYG